MRNGRFLLEQTLLQPVVGRADIQGIEEMGYHQHFELLIYSE